MLPALLLGLVLAPSPAADSNRDEAVVSINGLRPTRWESAAYPEEARRAGLSGEVVLECSIDPKGKVASLKILSGVSPLFEAAIYAVMEWRFDSPGGGGQLIPKTTVTMRFEAQPFHYAGLMESLNSATDLIRSTAARNLGTLRPGADASTAQLAAALQKLDELAGTDQDGGVRSAARSAAARLRDQLGPFDAASAAPSSAQPASTGRPVLDYDRPPKPIRSPRPQYPHAAFKARIEGTVLVEILIDAQGRVAGSKVVQSTPGLDEAALATVRKWMFQPAVKDGLPAPTLAHVPVAFRIY